MTIAGGYRWRVLVGVVFAMLIALLAPAAGAHAAVTHNSGVAMVFPAAPFDCKEAPVPTAPIGLLGDSTKPKITNKASADPFTNTDVPLASVYGWQYRWVSYDTGCKPGSGFLPSAGANLSNWITEPIGGMAGAGHAIHSSVLNPTWLEPIDAAVEDGVKDVRAATWTPYVGLSLLIVVVIMLWAARSGRLDGTVTAAVWAIVVMSLVTFLGSYPAESTKLLDGAVSESALMISTNFSEREAGPGQGALVQTTIDRQWDDILRATAFETWSNGTFGSSESQTAKEYGPAIFASTHLSWDEWDQVQQDPGGAGKDLIEKKQEDFKEAAGKIQESDPYAYNHLTGNEWGSRLATASIGVVGAGLAMLFLFFAGIGMFVGFIVIRVAIMFAPAAGVIFLIEKTRTMAIGMLAKVGKYIILGPIYLLAGLIVLQLNSAIASSEALAWWLQLLLFFVVSFVAWSLTRPTGGIPGFGAFRKIMRIATGTMLGIQLSGRGKDEPAKKADGESEEKEDEDTSSNDRPVVVTRERPRALEHQRMLALEGSPQLEDGDIPSQTRTFQPAAAALSSRRTRELSGSQYPAALPADSSSQSAQVVALGPGRIEADLEGSLPVQGSQPALVGGLTVLAEPGDPDFPDQSNDSNVIESSTAAAGTVGGANTTNAFDPSADFDDSPEFDDHPEVVVVRPSTQHERPSVPEVESANAGAGAGDDDEAQPSGSSTAPSSAGRSTPADPGAVPSPPEVAAMAREQGSMKKEPIKGEVLGEEYELDMNNVSEANLTYDEQNRPVYTVYRPAGGSVRHRAE